MPAAEMYARGRLGADPAFTSGDKKPSVMFSLACQANKTYPPVWIQCVAFVGQHDVIEKLKLHKGDYVTVWGPVVSSRKEEGSECKWFHTRVMVQQIFLIVRAQSSEEKHYADIEREILGDEEKAPF